MSLYWLEPGWKSAVCGCGANIWQSGGDPDWGYCWPCMQRRTDDSEAERRYYADMEREYYAAMICEECEPWFDNTAFAVLECELSEGSKP